MSGSAGTRQSLESSAEIGSARRASARRAKDKERKPSMIGKFLLGKYEAGKPRNRSSGVSVPEPAYLS